MFFIPPKIYQGFVSKNCAYNAGHFVDFLHQRFLKTRISPQFVSIIQGTILTFVPDNLLSARSSTVFLHQICQKNLIFPSHSTYNMGKYFYFYVRYPSQFLKLLNFKPLENVPLLAQFEVQNAHKVNFPQTAPIMLGYMAIF